MKIYTWTDGTHYDVLPAIMDNTSPITESWWLAHGGTIEEVPDPPTPPPVVRYSKYKLKLACEKRNLWEQVRTLIELAGKWESFLLINDIAADNQELQDVMPDIIAKFGAETVAAVLAESVAE